MTFKIEKPSLLPARGGLNLQAPVEKLNMAMNLLGRIGDPMQSAVRLGELIDAGVLQYNANGVLVAGRAFGDDPLGGMSFKNYLINGHHRWWQRGTSVSSFTNGQRYCADRWAFASALNNISTNRQAFDMGQTDVPGNPVFFQRCSIDTVDAGATAYTVYFQRIENLRRFANKQITISWYAKTVTGAREMSLELILNYGSGGSATENIYADRKYQLTTSWQRFSRTVTMPSMLGKVHNMGDSCLLIHFWFAAGSDANFQLRSGGMTNASTGFVDIACLQVEDGDTVTDFEFLPDAISLIQCQRFFRRFGGESGFRINMGLGFCRTGLQYFTPFMFQQMRAPPAVTVSAASTWRILTPTGAVAVTSSGVSDATSQTAVILSNVASGTVGEAGSLQAADGQSANATVDLDSEL